MHKAHPIDSFAERLRSFIRRVPETSGEQSTDAEFNQLALELFSLQFEHNPVYRRLCESSGVSPIKVQQWREIPALPTAAFKDHVISCSPEQERTAVFFSSGTTGQKPSRHFHHERSLAVYHESLLTQFKFAVGRHYENRNTLGMALTPPLEQCPNSSLVDMFDQLRKEYGFADFAFAGGLEAGAWVVHGPDTIERLERAATQGTRVGLLGTAFSFVHLLDYLAEQKGSITLAPGSWAMETGGYKGRSRVLPKAELHQMISDRLGLEAENVFCEYGMSELSSQAYDTADAAKGAPAELRRFQFPGWVRVQVIDPETGGPAREGQTGLLRVVDLANVYSAMAIQTEDLARQVGQRFELCGRSGAAEPRGCSLMPATMGQA